MIGKQVIKRLCAAFLCMVLFLTLLPAVSFADSASDYTIAPPTLVSLEKQNDKLVLTWAAVPGVANYSVHRKVNSGTWWTVAKVNSTSYTDTNVTGNTKYTYTVRCLDANGNRISWYDEVGLSYNMSWKNATPVVSGNMTTDAITVKWNAVSSTGRYSVHRKVDGGTWWTVAKVDATSYVDRNISVGHTYEYTVRCLDNNGAYASYYQSPGVSFTVTSGSWNLATPHVSAAFNGSANVITWNAVSNATRYSVHRRINDGTWWTIAKVTGTSFTDSNVSKGNDYHYTVRCIDNEGHYLSSYETPGADVDLRTDSLTPWSKATPVLTRVTNTVNGVEVRWDPVPGANRYSVHRRTNGGTWWTVGRVDTNVFLDRDVSAGNTYTYTVRVINSGNQYLSDYDPVGKSTVYYPCPNPDFTLTQSNGGITITWKAVNGAAKYSVHRKVDGGTWWTIAKVTGTSYTDKQVELGHTYEYTVRCLNSSGSYISWYSEKPAVVYNGIIKRVELGYNDPDYPIASAFAGKLGIAVKWSESYFSGASKYRILRKANDGTEWKTIQDVPAPASCWVDSTVASNNTYTYTVRGLNASGNYIGDYDQTGVTIRYYDPPELIEVTRDADGATITWNPVVGITNYQIYRKEVGSIDKGFQLVGSTQDLYFVDKYVTNNTSNTISYEYGVKCVSNDGKTVVSGMNVKQATSWLETPILMSAELNDNSVVFTFKKVDHALAYQVGRKTSNTAWEWKNVAISDLTADGDLFKYTDTTVVSGNAYSYTVRCTDNSTPPKVVSDYDRNGVQALYYEVPRIQSIWNSYLGVNITWEVVDNTGVYWVYRRVGDNAWEKIGQTEKNTLKYVDTTAQTGMYYWYALCSADLNNTNLSDLDKTHAEIRFFKAPDLGGVRNDLTGVEVTWSEVSGVTNYNVYRRVAGATEWQYVGSTGSLSLVDADTGHGGSVKNGTTYQYTVSCANGSNDQISGVDPNGRSTRYVMTPSERKSDGTPGTLTAAPTAENDAIIVEWNSVDGATQYNIYRKIPGQDYVQIGTAAGDTVTYRDTQDLIHEQDYIYTVRALMGDSISWYIDAGSAPTHIN